MIFVLQACLIGLIAWTVTLYMTRTMIAIYHTWLTNFDFGIVEEAAYRFSRGDALFLTTRGDHAFADNQKYFQFLFGVLNWLHLPQPMSITLLHTLLGLLTGYIVALIFKRQGWTIALLMAAITLLNPMLLNMVFDMIHSEILTPIFLLLAYYFWRDRKKLPFVIVMVLSLLIKEDVAFTVFALAFCYAASDFFFEREKLPEWKNIYLFLMVVSILIFTVNMFIILPAFKEWTCHFLGETEASKKMIGHQPANPWYSYLFEGDHPVKAALRALWKKRNLLYLIEVSSLLWLWNYRSLFFLALIPAMVLNMLSWADYQTSMYFHYEHTLLPVVMIGVAEAARRMSFRQNLWRGLLVLTLLVVVPPHAPNQFRMSLWGVNRPPFSEVAPTQDYKTLMWLQKHLPKNANITGHYAYITYLMPPANLVFEAPNPYVRHYFGIYGVCEDWKRSELPEWWILKTEEIVPPEMKPFLGNKISLRLGPITVYADPGPMMILDQALIDDPLK